MLVRICVQDSSIGAANPFNAAAFLKKRSRIMGCSEEPMVCLISSLLEDKRSFDVDLQLISL